MVYFYINNTLLCKDSEYKADINEDMNKLSLHPYWITGFTDAEGCFTVKFAKSNAYKLGWKTQAQFQIKLHARDLALLTIIKDYYGVGVLGKSGNYIIYTVKSTKDLVNVIIPHFEKYPLMTHKAADFILFKQIVLMMEKKEHLIKEKFEYILTLKASLNLGLSENLSNEFMNIVPAIRPIVNSNPQVPNPNWLTGFIDGEGCFHVNIKKSDSTQDKVWLTFQITQHIRDSALLESIIKYLNCGRVNIRSTNLAIDYLLTTHNDVNNKLIPFFQEYPLQSVKIKDYLDFCKVINLINNKEHLTKEGVEKIKILKKWYE